MNTKTMKRKQYASPGTCILELGDIRLLSGSPKVKVDPTKQGSQSGADAPAFYGDEDEEEPIF